MASGQQGSRAALITTLVIFVILFFVAAFYAWQNIAEVKRSEDALADMKKLVKRVIPEGDRRDALLSGIDTWESLQEERDKKVHSDREELLEVLRRHDATRAEVEAITAKLETSFVDMDASFLNLRFRLKERVSSAEWAQLLAR